MTSIEGSTASLSMPYPIGASGDNEAIEKTPDYEEAEKRATTATSQSTPKPGELAAYQGGLVDLYA